ncbi:MAG: transglutaminase family protein [Armatimonadaceae bacterium]
MLIRIGFDIVTRQSFPTPMILMLHTRPELKPALVRPDDLVVSPPQEIEEYTDIYGNRCTRIVACPGSVRLACDAVIENDGQPDRIVPDAIQHPVEELPQECLLYLLSSRYCEVDRLSGFAWEKFGHTKPGWERVQAVCDFVHNHVTFGYQFASPNKTAKDVLDDGKGVCRDYQHLAVTLCRALGIPARYCSGYLGSIRIPAGEEVDFSAWFEVYLGGQWYAFDARYNTPRIGRTLMVVARDATDTALITSFGRHELERFKVICEEIESLPEENPVPRVEG